MKIKSAIFVKGVIGTDDILFDGKFQVALMGRSNVGKSTLINSLVMRKGLARSSSTPGKTIRMDFFLINNSFYFVDFPGIGYARHSLEVKEQLMKMALWYLENSEIKNRLLILVIDAKVGITDYDRHLLQIFMTHNISHIIVANKIDHVDKNQKQTVINSLQKEYPNSEVVPFSSKEKNKGYMMLMQKISSYVNPKK